MATTAEDWTEERVAEVVTGLRAKYPEATHELVPILMTAVCPREMAS